MNPMVNPEPSHDPIFILGIMQRSGTNFLDNLLLLHPDCDVGGAVWEDFLVHHAELLVRYADRVYNSWNPDWKIKVEKSLGSDPLCKCLGNGLISFLQLQVANIRLPQSPFMTSDPDTKSEFVAKKLVTVTPSIKNLKYFFRIFPRAHLIVIIRDGRSVVESGVRTFGWDYGQAMQKWADAARTIIQFNSAMKDSNNKYLIVRYEDLCADTKKTMTKILSFVGLDVKRYDFDTALNMYVAGSSELNVSGNEMHWRLLEKKADFNPLTRWEYWGRSLHERFNWVVGDCLEQFGYNKQEQQRYRFLWAVWNMILDIIQKTEIRLRWRKLGLHNVFNTLNSFWFLTIGKYLEKKN